MRFIPYRSVLCVVALTCTLTACASGTPHSGDLPLQPPSQPTSATAESAPNTSATRAPQPEDKR
ncbi:MAG: hypothetical protein AAFS10_19020 [Myxococcota bacterium]